MRLPDRFRSPLFAVRALGFAGLAASAATIAFAQPAKALRAPVVVELYQSQGCSSCPPALAYLASIADRPDVIALSFAVTYWDQLGWKDGFASPAYTQRQYDYANRDGGGGRVATPQFWVNGRTTVVGTNRAAIEAAIGAAAPSGPALALGGGKVTVAAGAAPAGGAEVWLARYDPRTVEVAIRAGENGGKTLPHRDIVRQLVDLGRWTGGAQAFALPKASLPGLVDAAFVQAGKGGPILSAARG